MTRPKALRYQDGQHLSKKRYRCSTCTRRFRSWADLWAHSEAMHGERPLVDECDLGLIEERRCLARAGVDVAELPVTILDLPAVGARS